MRAQFKGCSSCGSAGSDRYAVERLLHLVCGVLLPVAVNHAVAPWYLSHWALGRAADSYDAATALLEALFDQMVRHLKRETPPEGQEEEEEQFGLTLAEDGNGPAGGASPEAQQQQQPGPSSVALSLAAGPGGPQGQASPALMQVHAPLTDITATLARDAALWQRGLMSTPDAVHALVAASILLADRLAALQVCACACVRAGTLAGMVHGVVPLAQLEALLFPVHAALRTGGAAQCHGPERGELQQLDHPHARAARARGAEPSIPFPEQPSPCSCVLLAAEAHAPRR